MSSPKVKLKLQPVPLSVMRTAICGEYVRNMGLTDANYIRSIQQAVAEGLVSEIVVVAKTQSGIPQDKYTLAIAALENDTTINVDLSNGKSYTEALDVGLAGAVHWAVQRIQRNRLVPAFFVTWSAYANANPHHLNEACRRLNMTMVSIPDVPREQAPALSTTTDLPTWTPPPSAPPAPRPPDPMAPLLSSRQEPPPPGTVFKQVLSVVPGKDKGIRFIAETLKKLK